VVTLENPWLSALARDVVEAEDNLAPDSDLWLDFGKGGSHGGSDGWSHGGSD